MSSPQSAVDANTSATPTPAAVSGSIVMLPIEGMHCAACVGRAEAALRDAGAEQAEVNLALERARVRLAPDASAAALIVGLEDAGFGVATHEHVLHVTGMSCAACALRIESALASLAGVLEVTVNPATERAHVRTIEGQPARDALVRAVRAAGYGVASDAVDADAAVCAPRSLSAWWHDYGVLALAALLALPFLVQMVGMFAGATLHMPPWLELALATPVQLVAGWRFHSGAVRALRQRAPNMDVLVSMGTFAAYGYSVALMVSDYRAAGGALYFEAAVVVITLVLLGKALEARARRATASAIAELMALRPREASVWRDGRYQTLPLDEVMVGDRVLVRPGESIPVDALVREGTSDVNEAMVTGESVPVTKLPNDRVMEGTLNGAGALTLEVRAIGSDTTLARIIALVEQAQAGKAPVQQLVDRVSRVFVPIVIAVALVTFAAWMLTHGSFASALMASVAVLVVACPCALGLATPTAIVVGTGVAARAGILVKEVQALEALAAVDVVAFDKTGTLTEGRPSVAELLLADGASIDEAQMLALAAAAQRSSEHLLGRAIVSHAEAMGVDLREASEFTSHPGRGVEARVDGHRVIVGNALLMQELDVSDGDHALIGALDARRQTRALVAVDGALVGAVLLEDPPKSGARDAIAALRARGIECLLLTGDSNAVAAPLARSLGIEQVAAGLLPGDKSRRIAELTAGGRSVAMVGDGVNDAPALAAADVGLAMATGTDVAVEAAGITLMRGDPTLVASAQALSAAVVNKIRQNLFWAFVYNVVCIPIAALGLLSPALAGAAMALSSVSVVSNALLLKRWRPLVYAKRSLSGRPSA